MPNYYKSYRERKDILPHQKINSVKAYSRCRFIDNKVIKIFINQILGLKPTTILDAGVGNGRFFIPLQALAPHKTKLIGVDISQPMLDDLKNKIGNFKNVTFYQADLRDKKFFRRKLYKRIDAVYSFATLHIISENWESALDNLINCLTNQGTIILGEEINAVFHGSENIYESGDSRLFELRRFFETTKIRQDIDKVTMFFKKWHELRTKFSYPFTRENGQILHGDQSPAERYLRTHGFLQMTVSGRKLSWLKPHTFEDIIYALKFGTTTTLGSDLPDFVRAKMAVVLNKFCLDKKFNIKKIMHIPSTIQMHIFKKL